MAKLSEKRKQLLRENRKLLREAGFSVADADRFKGASRTNVLAAILAKALPKIREEKRHRAKVKYNEREFKYSKAKLREVLNFKTTKRGFEKLMKELPKNRADGYSYFYVRVTINFTDGTFKVFQSNMTATSTITSEEQLKDIITKLINLATETYKTGDEDDIESIIIDIMFWKPNANA
jgi:hypothetical protein